MHCNDELQKANTCCVQIINTVCLKMQTCKCYTHCIQCLYLETNAHVCNAQQFAKLAHVLLPWLTHMGIKTEWFLLCCFGFNCFWIYQQFVLRICCFCKTHFTTKSHNKFMLLRCVDTDWIKLLQYFKSKHIILKWHEDPAIVRLYFRFEKLKNILCCC